MKELNRKTVFEGVVFNVIEKQIELDNGQTITRQVVESSPVVHALCFDADSDSVYVLEEYRSGCGRVTKGIVGGKIDAGETPEEAVTREIKEELGCTPVQMQAVSNTSFYSTIGISNEEGYYYIAFVKPLTPEELALHSKDSDEYINVSKVSFDEFHRMLVKGEIPDLKVMALWTIFSLKEAYGRIVDDELKKNN